MSNFTKLMQEAAAGAAGGAGLNIEDVFSTYLYDGNSTARSIVNGIDLDGEGGLVWTKIRDTSTRHVLIDTERGATKYLESNDTDAEATQSASLTSFNSNGYSIGNWGSMNSSSYVYASWTFRKAPKFFTCLTYTGNGSAGLSVSHNLGSAPGCIIVKNISRGTDWMVLHRNNGSSYKNLHLNTTNADIGFLPNYWGNGTSFYQPTSTDFQVGTGTNVNFSGDTYVAYLFAHNDGDGEFGPDADLDAIKCGSYTGNSSTDGPEINLGFEPQWVLIKNTTQAANWRLVDVMRGFDYNDTISLYPNLTAAEGNIGASAVVPTPTGFKLVYAGLTDFNTSGANYIYIAIRRGPMGIPESATDVFAIDTQGSTGDGDEPSYRTTFPVDMVIQKPTDSGNGIAADRLRGTKRLFPNATNAETNYTSGYWDYMNGWRNTTSTYAPNHAFMWRRAPNFCDVVAYTGNGTSGRTLSHNLGVAPEMMWVKSRSNTRQWAVYHKDIGNSAYLNLDDDGAANTSQLGYWNNTSPTSSVFTLGNSYDVNSSLGYTYIAYLFASLDGISKVGSYSGTESGNTIDCGFSSSARFVLIKRTDSTGSWYLWDSERGIIVGDDPYLLLNDTSAQVTNTDYIVPNSSGFRMQAAAQNAGLNNVGGSYIFYAIA